MPRALRIFLFAAAALGLLLAVAYALLFHSPPGRASLKSLAAEALSRALGADAAIGRLGGGLPGEIRLEDVALADAEGVYLTINRVRIVWRPGALADRRIEIASIEAAGGTWRRRPAARERTAPPKGYSLPESLPRLRIGRLVVENFEIAPAIAGASLKLDGEGAARTGGRDLDIALTLTSARDFASIAARRTGDDFSVDATVASEDGALAALADFGGPLFLEAKGSGPVEDGAISLRAALGAVGVVDARLHADFGRLARIDADGIFRAGARIAELADIVGPEVSFRAAFIPDAAGGDLALERFAGDFGAARGAARWRNRAGALDSLNVELKADFAEAWRPDIRRWTGGAAAASLALTSNGGAYLADLALESGRVSLTLAKAETDARTVLRGPFAAAAKPDPAAPKGLRAGAVATGRLAFVRDETIELTDISAESGDSLFTGAASYDFAGKAVKLDGQAAVGPALVAQFAPAIALDRAIAADIALAGRSDDFVARVVATTPPATLKGERLAPARATLAFAGLPDRPAGEANLRALDGSTRFFANAGLGEDGFWRLARIDYQGRGFALAGDASFNARSGEGAADLSYRGDADAEPWPGIVVGGEVSAKGSLSRSAARNRIVVKASRLAAGSVAAAGFDLSAEGPMSALAVRASASAFSLDRVALDAVRLAATLDARGPVSAALTEFAAQAGGRAVALKKPATLIFDDAAEIRGLSLSVGRRGGLDLDAAVSKERWRARLVAEKLPLEAAAALVDASIDLDTDRPEAARGAFAAASLLTNDSPDRIGFKFDWDGRRLRLEDDGADPKFDLDASLPVALARRPALGAKIAGPLSGTARYAGRLEPVAAFFPPALQSLEGDLELEGRVAGDAAAPQFAGTARLTNGAYTEVQSGLSVVEIEAAARGVSTPGGGAVDFEAKASGPGQSKKTIAATGRVEFAPETRLRASLGFDGARLAAGPVGAAIVDGAIEVRGPAGDLKAEGEIKVRQLDAEIIAPEPTGLVPVNVVVVGAPGDSGAPLSAGAQAGRIAYDIRLTADDRIFVRGRGVESEWRADARLAGTAEAPLLLGDIGLQSGIVDFAGRRFALVRGAIAFDRLAPNNPALDLRAERTTAGGVTASIEAGGRARSPRISLQSAPSLPQEDIMALVLFDKPANELSAFESLEVARALASLGGVGPFGGAGVTGKARQALGLDLLAVDLDTDDTAASALTVGKYVADGLFVAATQDARGENGSIRIEYDVGKSFSVETELRQDGDQTVSANWSRDF